MGKRPYYLIYWTRDCDGYEFFPEYIGTNYKAALERYVQLFEYIRQNEFIDEGVNPDHIRGEVNLPRNPLLPGQEQASWINDDDTCWISVHLRCVTTGEFMSGVFERRYKEQFPNAKY